MRRPRCAAVVLCLCALLSSCAGPAPNAPAANVYIPRGASLAAVTDSLVQHRVVTSRSWFRLYARLVGLARRVRPGLYEFPEGERFGVIVGALKTGRTHDFSFTAPEGLTVAEIADLAAAKLRLARDSVQTAVRDSFLAAARDPALARAFGIAVPAGVRETLEGYLLPETYRVAYDETPRQLVEHMLRQFTVFWDTGFDRRAAALGLSRHQVLTLASVVEAEARSPGQRRRVAGVYMNRLRRGMPMQADPTVMYAVGQRLTRVLFRHLETRSPYNTYLHAGLPPGPICNPSRSSIEASLDPEEHAYLFFVATPDGQVMYSNTASQHADSANVARGLWAHWAAEKAHLEQQARDSASAARRAASRLPSRPR